MGRVRHLFRSAYNTYSESQFESNEGSENEKSCRNLLILVSIKFLLSTGLPRKRVQSVTAHLVIVTDEL